MTLFPADLPVLWQTDRVRVRRIRPRRLYDPYLSLEQFFPGTVGGGSWTRLADYELEREADAIEAAKYLDNGHSFADWRDMRKARGLPR